MEPSTSETACSLFRPTPLVFSSSYLMAKNNFIAVAGSDISLNAQVFLLYEVPVTLLARRFLDATSHEKLQTMAHELNGCLVGPGLYQEWTAYIHAARNTNEQNLELCRSSTNNMLFYRVLKPIKKGECLLAWYSSGVEKELAKSLLNQETLVITKSKTDNVVAAAAAAAAANQCKRCHIDFEQPNMLKSHLLFDLCGKSYLSFNSASSSSSSSSSSHEQKNGSITTTTTTMKKSITPPSSAASSSSSSSSSQQKQNHRLSKSSAFSPISSSSNKLKAKAHRELNETSDNSELVQQLELISPKSSSPPNSLLSSSSSSSSCSSSNKKADLLLLQQTKSDCNNNNSNNNNKKQQIVETASQQTSAASNLNGVDWKITMLDGTQTVELNMPDEQGKQKKTHVCLFCGKIYNRKYGLKIHLRTHTGYKPLKCKVCSRPFSDPSNLNKHVRLHSQGETPYRCPYCAKILVRKRDLDRHIISRHSSDASGNKEIDGEEEEEEEEDVLQDEYNQNFSDRSNENSRCFYFKSEQLDETD